MQKDMKLETEVETGLMSNRTKSLHASAATRGRCLIDVQHEQFDIPLDRGYTVCSKLD